MLAYYNKATNFIFGAISVSIFIYIFYQADLLGESILNLYYLIVSIYGIVYWNKKNRAEAQIGHAKMMDYLYAAAIFIACYTALSILFIIRVAPIELINYADMYVTAMAFAGTFLLLKRKIENWIVLNLSNLVAIPVQLHKELYLIAILTAVFFVLAVLGYFRWRKLIILSKTI